MNKALAQKQDNLPTPTDAFLLWLEKAISTPEVEVDKLSKMLDVKERVLAKSAESEFNASMNACQTAMGRIAAKTQNTQTHSKYASYAELDKVLRPIYTANGFSLSFGTEQTTQVDHVRVCCDIAHRAGHTKHVWMDVPADTKGPKGGDVMTKTHAAGAATSYGMRYLLKMIFNVAVGEDDDDGNSGQPLPNVWKSQETRKHYSTELLRCWGRGDTKGLRTFWDELDNDQKANVWSDFTSVVRREMNVMLKETQPAVKFGADGKPEGPK